MPFFKGTSLLDMFCSHLRKLDASLPEEIDIETASSSLRSLSRQLIRANQDEAMGSALRKAMARRRRKALDGVGSVTVVYGNREITPLHTFMILEACIVNEELRAMKSALQNARKWCCYACRVDDISRAVSDLEHSLIPASFGLGTSLRIDDWLAAVSRRRNDVYTWTTTGTLGRIDLASLRDPVSLIYSLREEYSFTNKCSVEDVRLEIDVLKKEVDFDDTKSAVGVVLCGLVLTNALWDAEQSKLKLSGDGTCSASLIRKVLRILFFMYI